MKNKKQGIIARLVVGKKKESDLLVQDLPTTRLKLFKSLITTRFGLIFKANLLAALFWLPFIAWMFISAGYVQNVVQDFTAGEYFSHLIYLTLLQYGTLIPLYMLAFVGLAGIFYVVRRICWGQTVRIVSDFGKGIKDSWKQFLGLGLITGIINMLLQYVGNAALLLITESNSFACGLVVGLTAVIAIIYCVMLMFAFTQSSLYNLSFFTLIKNSVILTFKRLWRSLLICFLSLLPILIFICMPWVFLQIIGACVAIVIGIGFMALTQTVYCHGVFDDFINKKDYPDFVGIGLSGGKMPEEIQAQKEPSAVLPDGNGEQEDTVEQNGGEEIGLSDEKEFTLEISSEDYLL